jgi:hypothetical protein
MDGVVTEDVGATIIFTLLWPFILVFLVGVGVKSGVALVIQGIAKGTTKTLMNLEARGRGGKES